ncbi:MAG TPA: inorganic phosphate transporter [Candidatus Eremiobacteraceae bacterium]|nr:inorganic phosphate transporter [Candidatus Eremiobacteraceae bacterium]
MPSDWCARCSASESSKREELQTHPGAFAVLLTLAIAYTLISGATDGGSLLAAAAASRVVSPLHSLCIIALGVLVGPIIFGTAVAATIAVGIADYPRLGASLLAAGIAGGLATRVIMYFAGVPTSGSVALVGAMVGSLWAGPGLSAVNWHGVAKVAIALVASPLAGFVAGALAYAVVLLFLSFVSRRIGDRLMRFQYATIALQALAYGANDAEKTVGLFAAALLVAGGGNSFAAPLWTIALTAATFTIGMLFGGMRIARTIGNRLYSIRSPHALAFQTAAALTVLGAASLGAPMSSTQTATSAILGVGAGDNPRSVQWRTAGRIVSSWALTAPTALGAGAVAALCLRLFR